MASSYGNFTPEARIYSDDKWNQLTSQQKQSIQDLKGRDGWVNGQTPPPGCTIDQHGYATALTALVAAVQQTIAATSSDASNIVPLPPAPQPGTVMIPPASPSPNSSVPPVINTNASTAGASFGRRGTRVPNSNNSTSQVSMVSINGTTYNGPIFDGNGNRLA